ncbi:glycosyltransferase family 2 protein, partial [Vibrio diabolicus]
MYLFKVLIFLYLERVIVLNEIKVSVVIPVYNRADVIYTSIISVLEQNGDFPIEIIIVDDFSDDRIKLLKNVNKII